MMGNADNTEPAALRTESSAPIAEVPDRLTIGRLLLITAGVAAGLTLFAPHIEPEKLQSSDSWRGMAFSLIVGLTLPVPLFGIGRVVKKRSLGVWGLFALALGLGAWLMMPAAIIEYLEPTSSPNNEQHESFACLYFVMPMMGLWCLLAGLVSGHAGRALYNRTTPWIDRYGFLLALLWSPLGAWQVVDVYRAVL